MAAKQTIGDERVIVSPRRVTLTRTVQLEPFNTEVFSVECDVILSTDVADEEAIGEAFLKVRAWLNIQTRAAYENWEARTAGVW